MQVVICGGGVIGACTAYFLSLRGIEVIVIERAEVAAAASGKAGGFLALDWCADTPLDALARRSFQLHAALPDRVAGDWGYRRLSALAGWWLTTAMFAVVFRPTSLGCQKTYSSRTGSAHRKQRQSLTRANSLLP
jgi:FAD dependent oxidoreductase